MTAPGCSLPGQRLFCARRPNGLIPLQNGGGGRPSWADGVVAVGGGYHSSVGVAGKDVANDRGIPVVFAETWNDTITGDKQKYIFRIAPLSSWASGVIWKFAAQAPGVKKVAIVTENTDYGIPAAAECEKGLASKGIGSTTFGVDIGTQDFAGIVERVKAEDPDYVIVLLTGEAGYNYAQQAADAGIGPMDMMFHANQAGLESKSWWENVPDGNLAFMARIGVPETMYNETALKFAEDYKAKTGKTGVESYALEAYDSIGVLAQAINEAGSTSGDAIVDALKSLVMNSENARRALSSALRRASLIKLRLATRNVPSPYMDRERMLPSSLNLGMMPSKASASLSKELQFAYPRDETLKSVATQIKFLPIALNIGFHLLKLFIHFFCKLPNIRFGLKSTGYLTGI